MFVHWVLGPVGLGVGKEGVFIAVCFGAGFVRGSQGLLGVESPDGDNGDEGSRFKCAGKLDCGFCCRCCTSGSIARKIHTFPFVTSVNDPVMGQVVLRIWPRCGLLCHGFGLGAR